MATFRKRRKKDGQVRWQAEVRLKGVPPQRATFSTKTSARLWAGRVEDGIRAGRLTAAHFDAEKRTLGEAIDRYLTDHLGELGAGKSQQNRASQLGWWKRRIGEARLSRVSVGMVSDCLRGLRDERGITGATSNRYKAALSAVFKAATDWDWGISGNPAARAKHEKEAKGRDRVLREDERDRLLAACERSGSPILYPLVLFALATGARQAELLGLRWEDVRLHDDPPTATLHNTKNGDTRSIAFPARAGEMLQQRARIPHISGYVLGRTTGMPRFPRKAWNDAVEEAGIEGFVFHSLRHTAASWAAMSGATLPELMAFLGHRSLASVQRYAHLTKQHQAEVAARMAERYLA